MRAYSTIFNDQFIFEIFAYIGVRINYKLERETFALATSSDSIYKQYL